MAIDIAPELYDRIMKIFQGKYDKAEQQGTPIGEIRRKLDAGTATFRDADLYAVKVGNMLSESMIEVLQLDQMPNQQLYYNIAQRTIGTSLQETYGLVSSVAAEVQEEMNEAAGIGIRAAVPKVNDDRIRGLVDKAAEAEDQKALNAVLRSPVENLMMSAVDETVKENAKLQSKAGLQPIIKRTTTGHCCEWCSALAGIYKYPDDVPDEVYHRHRNCRCTVEYIGAGKRQDVWSKREDVITQEQAKELEKELLSEKEKYLELVPEKDVTEEYIRATRKGKIEYEEGYDETEHKNEVEFAKWINRTLGGDITLLTEINQDGVKTPDYVWNGKLWELKTVSTENAANKALRKGIHQIENNPGGVILDYGEKKIDRNLLIEVLNKRMQWYPEANLDILIRSENKFCIIRYR